MKCSFFLPSSIIILLLTTSCLKDDYSFQNFTTSNYNPYIGVPLINTSFNFNDLLFDTENNEYLFADSNNLLYISFLDTVASIEFNEMLDVPSQSAYENFQLPPFEIEDFTIDTAVTLGKLVENMLEPEKSILQSSDGQVALFPAISYVTLDKFPIPQNNDFEEAEFSQGTLSLTITNNLPIPITNVTIEIRNSIDNSLIGTFDFPYIASIGNSTDQINLSGVVIKYPFEINVTSLSSPGSGTSLVNIDLQSELRLHFSASGLQVISGIVTVKEQLLLTDTIDIDLQMPNGEELHNLTVNTGNLKYNIDYGMMLGAEIIVKFPYITLNGNALTETILINPQGPLTQLSGEIDLAGCILDLTANNTTVNNITSAIEVYSTNYNNPVEVDTSDQVMIEFVLDNMDISYAEGYVGQQALAFNDDTLYFPFEEGSIFEKVKVEDPQITLFFDNSFGIPGSIDMNSMIFYNEQNTSLSLTGDIINNALNISAPTYGQYGTYTQTSYTLSNQNSNLKDAFALLPNKAIINGSFVTNPNGYQDLNFLGSLSKLNLLMKMDIPIYGSLSRISIKDTLEFDGNTFNNIRSAILKIVFDNGYPIDLDVQVHFADEEYNLLDSLIDGGSWLAESATVNVSGDVTANKMSFADISVNESKMNTLRDAKYIILDMGVATSDNGSIPVKFYTHYKLGLKLGIVSQINL